MMNVLTLLSTSIWLFPPLATSLADHDQGIGGLLKTIINAVFRDLPCLERLKEKVNVADWPWELAECLASLAEGMCWFGDGSVLWLVLTLLCMILAKPLLRYVGKGTSLLM